MLNGDLDWVAEVYDYPLSVFVEGNIRIESGPEDTATHLMLRREQAQNRGVYAMTAEVMQINRSANSSRFSVIVDYLFHAHDGVDIARNRSKYRCRSTDDGSIKVESLEFLNIELSFIEDARRARPH